MKINSRKSLDQEIHLVQIEKRFQTFQQVVTKQEQKLLRDIFLCIAGVGISIGIIVLFPTLYKPIIVSVLLGGLSLRNIVSDMIESKATQEQYDSGEATYSEYNDSEETNSLLTSDLKKGEDFYQDEVIAMLKEPIKENNTKLSKFTIVSKNETYLNKEQTMIQIVKEIEDLSLIYKTPCVDIKNKYWDILFDKVYEKFQEKGIEKKFYQIMSDITRILFAKALVNQSKIIQITDFIHNLYYLESGNPDHNFTNREVLKLQQSIISSINQTKIIPFKSFAKKKR